MSAITDADIKATTAKKNLRVAYQNLLDCANSTWGWDDYNSDYQDVVLKSAMKIKKILTKL